MNDGAPTRSCSRAHAYRGKEPYPVKGILNFAGMSLGSWVGWALGKPISLYTGIMLSFVGTGVGLYAAIRVTKALLP